MMQADVAESSQLSGSSVLGSLFSLSDGAVGHLAEKLGVPWI